MGEEHGKAKLTWDDVRLIRELAGHLSYAQIAIKFDVGRQTVVDVIKNRTWTRMG